jgi:hypothetical protein
MKEIEAGRIGEVICLLRLAKMGIQSEIVNLGTSDIISFAYERTWRIQVKSSQIKGNKGSRDTRSPGYQFCVAKGLKPKKSLTEADCDIVALVGIPQERVLFAPVSRFSGVLTKRLKPLDYLESDVEWSSWKECVEYYGVTNPPRPSSLPIPDQLLTVLGDPHKSP